MLDEQPNHEFQITSPNYPENYNDNLNIIWNFMTLKPLDQYKIKIRMTDMEVSYNG